MSNPLSARRTQRSQLLNVVEYTSTAASVVGVVISALSQQAIYAAAPLSLSLCLNLVNRRRFEQQTEQQFNGAIAQIDQRLLNLDQRVLERNETAIDLIGLRSQLSQLHDRFTTTQQGQNATATYLSELQAQLSQINAQLTTIQQHQTHAETSQVGLNAQIAQVRETLSQEIQGIRQQLQSLDGVEALQQAFPDLKEEVSFLQQRQNLTATSYAELQMRLADIGVQLTVIQQRQADAETIETGLNTQVSQVREILSQEIQGVRHQIQAANLSLDGLKALQQAFPRLADRVAFLQQQQSPTSTDHAEVQARLSQIDRQLRVIQQRYQAENTISQTIAPKDDAVKTPIVTPPEEPIDLGVLSLNLGIDFGTSFTKVCFRDVARDRSEIVTFTDDVTHLEGALLPTKIGVLSDGTLIAGLTAAEWKPYENQVQTTVEFIKMRLANCDLPQGAESWQLKKIPGLSEDETIENLCAYYLSRVMTRAKAWIRQNKPELIINQKIEWSANVGVPVEYCDSPAIKRFETVLSLAWLLSNEPQTEQMTIENLRDRMKPLRATLEETAIDCHAIPEIAAEVWSLLNSREVDEGFYVLFDVGDGTLDGSSFRYWNDEGEKKVDFFFGKVNPLGVTAFSQRLAQELGIAETDAKNTICGNSTRYSDQVQTSTARKEIQRLVANVVFKGSQRYGEHGFKLVQRGFEKPLEILIGGGGGQTSFYTQAITSTHKDAAHKNAGIPEYAVRSLPFPKDLETNGIRKHEFHRFAVAYGLSIPEGEQPKLMLPSEMERIKPKTSKQDDSGQPPSYEDMRGSC